MAKDEVAIQLKINVPDMLFKRPQLQARITIPDDVVTAPVVSAEVLDNVRQVLAQTTGLDVQVALITQPE